MFKNLTGLAQMLRNAGTISQRVQEMKDRLASQTATGAAGGDMVQVEISGIGEVKRVHISPELIARQDKEMLEDLIPAAMNEALVKVRAMHIAAMKELTGGIDIPGLDEVLTNI